MTGRKPTAKVAALILGLAVACLAGCGSGDPRAKVLKERVRWQVQLLNWVQTEDGWINVTARVSGPPNSSLEQLTVRFDLRDAGGQVRDGTWRSLDLSKAPRGGPADLAVRLPAGDYEVESLDLVNVLEPTADEEPHIKELQF